MHVRKEDEVEWRTTNSSVSSKQDLCDCSIGVAAARRVENSTSKPTTNMEIPLPTTTPITPTPPLPPRRPNSPAVVAVPTIVAAPTVVSVPTVIAAPTTTNPTATPITGVVGHGCADYHQETNQRLDKLEAEVRRRHEPATGERNCHYETFSAAAPVAAAPVAAPSITAPPITVADLEAFEKRMDRIDRVLAEILAEVKELKERPIAEPNQPWKQFFAGPVAAPPTTATPTTPTPTAATSMITADQESLEKRTEAIQQLMKEHLDETLAALDGCKRRGPAERNRHWKALFAAAGAPPRKAMAHGARIVAFIIPFLKYLWLESAALRKPVVACTGFLIVGFSCLLVFLTLYCLLFAFAARLGPAFGVVGA